MTTFRQTAGTVVPLLTTVVVIWALSRGGESLAPAAPRPTCEAAVTEVRRTIEQLMADVVRRAAQPVSEQERAHAHAVEERLREMDGRLQRLDRTLRTLALYADQIQRSLAGLDKSASTPTVLERAAQRQRAVLVDK